MKNEKMKTRIRRSSSCAPQCPLHVELPPENDTRNDPFLCLLDNLEIPAKYQPTFSQFSPRVELPSENASLAIIGKLVESNSQMIRLLNDERLTNSELAMENARLKIELGNVKAAHPRDHEARNDEKPSAVICMQRVFEKIPQVMEGTQTSNLTTNKQEIEQGLSNQLK